VTVAKLRGADGVALLKLLTRSQPTLEVVVLTGCPEAKDAVESLRAGALVFLEKPQPVTALVKSIHEAFRSHEARSRAAQEEQINRIIDERPA
jgi:FixJ family two-component response regulator